MGCVYGAKHQQAELYFATIAEKETKKERLHYRSWQILSWQKHQKIDLM